MTGYLILDTTPLLAAAVSGVADQFLPANNGGKILVVPQDVINEINTGYPSGAAAASWLQSNAGNYIIAPQVSAAGAKNAGETGIGQYIKNNLSGQDVTVISENPNDWQAYIYFPASSANVNSINIRTTTGYLSEQILSGRASFASVVPPFDRVVSQGGLQLVDDTKIPNIFGPSATGNPGGRSISSATVDIINASGGKIGSIMFPGLSGSNISVNYNAGNNQSALFIPTNNTFALDVSGGVATGTIKTLITNLSTDMGPTNGVLYNTNNILNQLGIPLIPGTPAPPGTLTINPDGSINYSQESNQIGNTQIFTQSGSGSDPNLVNFSVTTPRNQIYLNGSAEIANGTIKVSSNNPTDGTNFIFAGNFDTNNSELKSGDVSGSNFSFNASNAFINVMQNSAGRLVGDFDQINLDNGSAVKLDGSHLNITATYASLNLNQGTSDNVSGSSSTIALQANSNSYVGVSGQNQTVTGDTGNDSVNLLGDGTSATVSGGGYVGLCGSNQSLTFTDGGSRLLTVPDAKNESITANASDLTLSPDSSANVSGSGDAIHLQANAGDYVGVSGQNQTVTGDTGNDSVNLLGDGTSATVSGGGYVGLCGNGENLTLTDQGSSVQTVGNAENEVVNANGSTISLAAGSLVNINGSSDTINLQGNTSETIGISGQGLTVSGDAGNDVVNLNANTSATVSGGGDVGLCGNGVTLTAEANQAFTINTAPGVTNDTVYADNSTLNLTPGWSGSIYGQGLTINMSPDSGSDVTIYGYDDQVTGNQGDTIQADAYDPNDTSDPYAPYQAGDPTPGTPYDPGDTTPSDPGDPGDPGDPYDPGEFEGEKIVATKTTAATPAPASSSTGGSAPSTGSTQPPVSTTTLAVGHGTTTSASSAHIASQASQLASAMAAFGGASGSETSLHTAPAAAQTTLTVDPSQPSHAAQPLRHAA